MLASGREVKSHLLQHGLSPQTRKVLSVTAAQQGLGGPCSLFFPEEHNTVFQRMRLGDLWKGKEANKAAVFAFESVGCDQEENCSGVREMVGS